MEPSVYVPAYLEREYLAAHPELTPAARSLVHDDVVQRPDRYATTDHARALVAYARARGFGHACTGRGWTARPRYLAARRDDYCA